MGIRTVKLGHRRLVKRWRRRLHLKDQFTPRRIYDDDVFLVSFPRSGNTWVRFLIGNLIKPPALTLHLRNINSVVAPVLALPQVAPPRPRIIKSHAPFHPHYPRVIYLLRDGRDAYFSYYKFLADSLPGGMTFGEFVTNHEHWPCSWPQHVQSWLTPAMAPDRFLLLRFEQLKVDPHGELARVARFVGLAVDEAQLERAVQAASFDNMQRLEQQYGGPGGVQRSGSFVRQGQSRRWQDSLTAAERLSVCRHLGPDLIRHGYERDSSWAQQAVGI